MTTENSTLVVCVAGKQGAGKSTVSKLLTEALPGSTCIKTSDVLVDTLRMWNLPITSANMQALSDFIKDRFGTGALANIVKQRIDSLSVHIVILDGVRGTAVLELMKKHYTTYVIYVESNADIRFERIRNRMEKESDGISTETYFNSSERHRTETAVVLLKSVADYVIENNQSRESLKNHVAKVSQDILEL